MMGKQNPVNKVISPAEMVRALQAGSITIAQAQAMFNGVIPIGDYKGIAAILDLDLLVNQPLVQAERLYALDRIDARDIVTATLLAGLQVEGNSAFPFRSGLQAPTRGYSPWKNKKQGGLQYGNQSIGKGKVCELSNQSPGRR